MRRATALRRGNPKIPAVLIGALMALGLNTAAVAQEIALTFDDLPGQGTLPPGETRLGVVARLVAALADAEAPPAIGFMNGASIEAGVEDSAGLRVWRGAGHILGNHGWSHANLDAAGQELIESEISRNEPMLAALAGDTDWRWFRYPFLAEGQTPVVRHAVRAVLRQRGYGVASVTMDFSDWAFNEPYARCRAAGDAAGVATLERLFLAAAEDALSSSRMLSNNLYGREIPYVLLLHIGAMDAHMLPRLLRMFEARGVRLVTLEQAMADPFYEVDRLAENGSGRLTLEAAASGAGLSTPPRLDVLPALAALCR